MNVFKDFYCEVDGNGDNETIATEILRILKVVFKPKYSKRPPRILLLGPPGSGKTSAAEILAKRYRLTLVSAENLLDKEIEAKTIRGQIATEMMEKGEEISDKIMGKIVEERLNQSDSKINGWILEGFPLNEAQARILKQEKHIPSLVIELRISDEIAFERCKSKRIDPSTKKIYSLNDEDVKIYPELASRLITKDCDSQMVEKRLKGWKSFGTVANELYKGKVVGVSAERPIKVVVEAISEEIEN